MKAYLYLASDGVDDSKKFGITYNLDSRLMNYNSSEHIRPVFFEETYVFENYNTARNAETNLRKALRKFIKQTYHIESFEWNKESKKIYYSIVKNFDLYNYSNEFVGDKESSKFPYHEKLMELIKSALDRGVPNDILENLIIQNKIGYYQENTPKRIIKENRAKLLVKLTNKDLYWDNKPRLIARMEKYYRLQEDIENYFQSSKQELGIIAVL